MGISMDVWRRGRRVSYRQAGAIRLTPIAIALCATWAGAAHAQQAGSAAQSTALPTVSVSAEADATTEDSGSYASRNATIGGRTPVPIKEIPASVSVLTRQRMDDQNMTTIQDALRNMTGVSAFEYGDGTAYYHARGTQLGIEFDGVSIVSGLQYLQQFDLGIYDRVELIRGPNAVLDGNGEPGGTVNLVRKRPQKEFHIGTETQVSSFGGVRQMVDVTGSLNKDGTLRGRAVLIGSDQHQSIDRARTKEVTAYGAIDWDITPRTTLSMSAGYQVNTNTGFDYGASGLFATPTSPAPFARVPSSFSQNFAPDWNYAYNSLQEVNANLVHRFSGGWKSQTTLFYRHEFVKADEADSGPGALAPGIARYTERRQQNTYDWFGADTNVSGPIQAFGRTHTLTVGANYSLMSETAYSGNASLAGPGPLGTFSLYDPNVIGKVDVPFTFGTNTRLVQYGFYAQARVKLLDPLTLVLGGREAFYEQRSQSLLPTVADWQTDVNLNHKFLPSVGLVWDITRNTTAYASFSRFLAAQVANEVGGSLVPPRTGEQYEIGVKNSFLGGRLNTTAALFRINDNNRAVADPNNPGFSIPAGKVRDQGFEFEVTGQPTENWNVYAGYTYLNAAYENTAADLSEGTDPKHLFKLWTKYAFSSGKLRGLSVGGGMLAQTQTTRGVVQGGYAIFNAQVGYRFNKHVEASLALNNIFNRDYYLRPPSNFYSVFGDRRNVMLTVRSDF
ncbi:TonB-dependent siderophore receptor [Burkholderia sp. ISTR5]|uniref:TonB-dependent siderophore receptor n=1 Tax=Burkholderia sp. ISTR5 TaxID=2500161 RepID=UPI00136BA6FC|nr:TonB-dependent siderophore receptor [Burkholderia sp. ISTR5]NBI45273.1 TonB-dependent siderophore receptor [Burkholderia sp. ISTR5]